MSFRAFNRNENLIFLFHGAQNRKKNFILQGVNQIIAAETEEIVVFIPKIQDGTAKETKGGSTLKKADGKPQSREQVGMRVREGLYAAIKVLFSLLFFKD